MPRRIGGTGYISGRTRPGLRRRIGGGSSRSDRSRPATAAAAGSPGRRGVRSGPRRCDLPPAARTPACRDRRLENVSAVSVAAGFAHASATSRRPKRRAGAAPSPAAESHEVEPLRENRRNQGLLAVTDSRRAVHDRSRAGGLSNLLKPGNAEGGGGCAGPRRPSAAAMERDAVRDACVSAGWSAMKARTSAGRSEKPVTDSTRHGRRARKGGGTLRTARDLWPRPGSAFGKCSGGSAEVVGLHLRALTSPKASPRITDPAAPPRSGTPGCRPRP